MFFSIVALIGMIYTRLENIASHSWLFLFMITTLIMHLPSQGARAEVSWKNKSVIEKIWSVLYIALITIYVIIIVIN